MEEKLIKNPKSYDPTKVPNDILLDDHRITHMWWSSLKKGKTLRHKDGSKITYNEIKRLHDMIAKEIIKRGMKHNTPLKLSYDMQMQPKDKEKTKSQLRGPDDRPIQNFPRGVQEDFRYVMQKKLKPRFVIQHHERGKSLHTDIRFEIPHKGYLQGFTIANPASINKEDKVNNQAKNVLVVEVKPHQPMVWLKVEDRNKKGEHGSTKHKAGIFTIVGKGRYKVWHVADHKIGIIFECDKGKIHPVKGRLRNEPPNLKQLTGPFTFTIAHIGDRHVGFFNHVKTAKLCKNKSSYTIEFLDKKSCEEIRVRPLRGFDGIYTYYCIQDNTATVQKLEFDKELWNKDRAIMFMKRYAKHILNYESDMTDYTEELIAQLHKLQSKSLQFIALPVPKALSNTFKMPYRFDFVALSEGKFNGVYYRAEDLQKSYKTLEGKDITKDHGKSIDDIIGKIISVRWNPEKERIEGIGEIYDKEIAKKIHQGLIKGVSVEVFVDHVKTEHGLTAANLEFAALSIVQKPACPVPKCGINVK